MRKIYIGLTLCFFAGQLQSQVSITGSGSYSQDFNTLISSGSGTWTDNSTITSWYAQRTGNGSLMFAGTGSSNSGGLYSFGSSGSTERALGSIGSGNAAVGDMAIGVLLENNSGQTVDSLAIQYTGEQWRDGGTANVHTMSFYYQIASSSITALDPDSNNAWIAVPSLNWNSPIHTTTAGELDGNLAANNDTLKFTITGLSLADGEFIMLKWDDPDHTGGDHGLSIDDFSVAWNVQGNTGVTNEEKVSVNLYPVPSGNTLQVQTAEKFDRLVITDVSGKNVLSQPVTAETISVDIATLTPGVYMITLNNAQGNVTKRFVKE